jgi:hypothetical protein
MHSVVSYSMPIASGGTGWGARAACAGATATVAVADAVPASTRSARRRPGFTVHPSSPPAGGDGGSTRSFFAKR